jgi:hypothetical protein
MMQLFPSPTVPTPQAATISNPQVDLASPIGRNCETFFQQFSQSVSQSVKLERTEQALTVKGIFKFFFHPRANQKRGTGSTNQSACEVHCLFPVGVS